MLIILGTTVKKKENTTGHIPEKKCPFCGKEMTYHEEKQYFTLFFIPIAPIKKISDFYFCSDCNYKLPVT